jgi:DNA-binding PadR family transcriptional regulator
MTARASLPTARRAGGEDASSVVTIALTTPSTGFPAAVSLDPTLMVALIDELERQGLCRRTRHPSDRRRYAIAITPTGSALLEQGLAIVGEIEQEILAPLSEPERQELARMLTRVMEPYWFAKTRG